MKLTVKNNTTLAQQEYNIFYAYQTKEFKPVGESKV